MLNPSKASADRNDPTVRRCIAYARRWGFGGIVVVNLFAMIATYPVELCRARDPVGPRNDDAILEGIRGRRVLLAWGTLSGWMPRHMVDRDVEVLRLLESTRTPAECLRVTKSGYPSHPVRLPRKLMPVPYERRAS